MTIIDGLVAIIFGTPFMTSISATGNIKNYQIIVNSCIMASLPISYIFLKLGYNVICVFVILIIISAISGMLRFYFCKRLIGFSVRNLINRVILPILSSTILTLFPTILTVYVLNGNNVLRFVITGAVSIISTLLSCWFIGLSHTEKQYVIEYIKKNYKVIKSTIFPVQIVKSAISTNTMPLISRVLNILISPHHIFCLFYYTAG